MVRDDIWNIPLTQLPLRPVHRVEVTSTLTDAALCIAANGLRGLVVCDGRAVVGILTADHIATAVLVNGLDPETTGLWRVMEQPHSLSRHESTVRDAMIAVDQWGLRLVPIVDGRGEIVGVVEAEDLARLSIRVLEERVGARADACAPNLRLPSPEHVAAHEYGSVPVFAG